MFDNLLPTYKKKVTALILGSLAFLILAYWLTISKTVIAYRTNNSMQERLAEASTVEKDISHYQQLLSNLDKQQQNQFSQETLFEFSTNFCQEHKLVIKKMPQANIAVQNDYNIMTNLIEVEGNFIAITQLIYALEQEEKLGHIVSCQYQLAQNRESRKQELVAAIYLQNIQSVN